MVMKNPSPLPPGPLKGGIVMINYCRGSGRSGAMSVVELFAPATTKIPV